MPAIRRSLLSALAVTAMLSLAACSDDNAGSDSDGTTDSTDTAAAPPTSTPDEPPCGVTLAEVQALLPADSGVTENATPDPGRCNFTWDDGGPRGIDVAIIPGGRSSFDVPAGYEPLDGYGDQAFTSTTDTHASAFAFVGQNLHAADVVAPTPTPTLHNLSLQLLALTLN